MKNKKLLLTLFLLITLLTLPITCNAEKTPILKWDELTQDYGYSGIHSELHNINNDILIVHNTLYKEQNYIRLYNNSGEKKWEYKQGEVQIPYFLINNEYLGLINNPWSSINHQKNITLLKIKDGTVYKNIDISKLADNDSKNYAATHLLYAYYYNNKIILFVYNNATCDYYLYKLDLDGNIEMKKKDIVDINYYTAKLIAIDNIIYSIDKNNIYAFQIDNATVNTTQANNHIKIANLIKYKDGIMYCGSIDGYMALEYYNLKTDTTQIKQFDEEGEIYTIATDNKDNLYIAGKYIDDNTTGKAYFSKYTINNWNFQKVYESFYEKKEYDEYFYTDMLLLKNNKLTLAGNTYDSGKYRIGLNFVVYYDGTKNYKIDKVIKGNGNLDIVESEEENNEVKYQVKPGFGYKLISLKIVTESGKEIEVSDDYSFVMPNENITITVVFEPIISNPVTSNNIIKVLLILSFSISVVYIITKSIRKRKFNN